MLNHCRQGLEGMLATTPDPQARSDFSSWCSQELQRTSGFTVLCPTRNEEVSVFQGEESMAAAAPLYLVERAQS